MIPVYRMQDDDGRGPFKPGFSKKWAEGVGDRDRFRTYVHMIDIHPIVAERIAAGMYAGCACQTIEQLRKWFSAGEYITLRGYGYRAVLVDADEVLYSDDSQLVIVRARPFREGAVPVPLYGPASHGKG